MIAKNIAILLFLTTCFLGGIANSCAANEHNNKGLRLSLSSSISSYDAPKNSFLATEAGAGPRIYDLFVSDPKHEYKTYGGHIGYSFAADQFTSLSDFFDAFDTIDLYAGYEQAQTEHNQFIASIDQPDTLIVPIPTGDVFSLTAPNEITNINYAFDYKYYDVSLGFKSAFKNKYVGWKIMPSAYLNYRQTKSDNSLKGSIDAFFRDFAYDTKVKVQSISPTIGLDTSYALTPKLNLKIGGKYAYNINRGRGRDSLFFTGFGIQEIEMKNDRQTHSFGAQAGVAYDVFPALTLELQGKYDVIGNAPRMDLRQEGKQSDFSYESSEVISGTVRATLNF